MSSTTSRGRSRSFASSACELQGQATIEGDWSGRVTGLRDQRVEIAMMRTPDGLSTTMELTIARRPFLYFPLANHCEQLYNVAHRLETHHAGRRLEYATTDAEALAYAALATLQTDTTAYRPHKPRAAERAARLISELF